MTTPKPAPDHLHIVAELRRFFEAQDEDIAAVYLFGSVARDASRKGSDVDVAVLFSEDPPRTLEGLHLGWAGDLAERLHRPVDLIVLNFASDELAHFVRKEGELVVERDREKRVLHEVASRRRYFDVLPHLKRYRYPELAQ